jgi:hypothetical protein
MNLVDALAQFNRKERYWLIRNALGEASRTLDKDFLKMLNSKHGIEVPANAWWAMDYHLDWLVGALHLAGLGGKVGDVRPNAADLVRGNQEDIDLVIAFNKTLILIEAKGVTAWVDEQLDSKLCRLKACFNYVKPEKVGLSVFFLLMSPRRPPEELERKYQRSGPSWMLTEAEFRQTRWVEMQMAEAGQKPNFLTVVRCKDEEGSVSKEGSHWKIQ